MCEQCVQTWKDLYQQLQKWPGWEDLTDEDDRAYDILFTYTGFPSVTPDMVREQLQYLCDHGPVETMNHIDDVMTRAHNELKMDIIRKELPYRRWSKDIDGNYQRRGFYKGCFDPYAYNLDENGEPVFKYDPYDRE